MLNLLSLTSEGLQVIIYSSSRAALLFFHQR